MSSVASLPPNAPMTNGLTGHGEADATPASSPTQTLAEVCADLHARISAFLSQTPPQDDITRRTQEQTRISLRVIGKALKEYGFDHLSISYNGGKDCLVLLILYLSALHTHFTKASSELGTPYPARPTGSPDFPTTIPSIYAKPPDPFPAVTTFVESSTQAYHLTLTHILTVGKLRRNSQNTSSTTLRQDEEQQVLQTPTHPLSNPPGEGPHFTFPQAFAHYLALNPHISSIFVGTRRTDPHGSQLTHFDRTDHNWPDFMRIHPVIDWRLSEIWCFLRAPQLRERDGSQLPYCSMYDEGYTSLGGVEDTLRNPKLRYEDPDGRERYKPAFEMTEDDEERLGRE